MKVIGITGGIASGKSTVASRLVEHGAHLVDADRLGHRAYEPGTHAYRAVVEAFGPEVVDSEGRIDRRVLGAKVFGRPEALERLTDIVWPEIRRLAEEAIAAAQDANPDGVVVLEAAVLFEAGWEDLVDEIWLVVTDQETALRRATERDGADEEAVQRRIEAQISNQERARRAHVVLENMGHRTSLETSLDAEWRRLMEAE